MNIRNFFLSQDMIMKNQGNGINRKITAFNENLMTVEVHFEKGAIGELHSHTHEQITYIVSGKFEFNIAGEKKVLEAGDSTYKQPNIEHGAKCLEAGMLLDIFTPCRKDFLK